mgnify:CR=1 FL=1|tara:strand:+ start:1211 stop:1402 length:192 start_codon:yes stop_codon:yes gene_type:complete
MADYSSANVKIIISDISDKAASVSGSQAKDIQDFIRTLSSNTIVSTDVVKLDRTRAAYIIVYT